MPPRSTRKSAAAAAKKQSPRLKKSTPLPSNTPVVVADDADPTAEITPTAEEDQEPKPTEEEEEVAVEKVGEGVAEAPSEAVEGGDVQGSRVEDGETDAKEKVMDVDNEAKAVEIPLESIEGGDVEKIDAKEEMDVDKDARAVENPSETIKEADIQEFHCDAEEIDVKVKMDSDKEVDEQLVEDEMRKGKVENVHANAVEKVGIVEGTARVCVDSGEVDDDENEEKTDDKESDEEADDKESDEEADDKESDEEPDTKESEEEADDKENEEEAEAEAEADIEDDPALYTQASLAVRKKEKQFEIFVGGLDRGAVEEDLIKVFGPFGEIQSVRIVKHPVTQKSKGFAFVRYASMEHARKVLTELKSGTEVKGKIIRISASEDNDTLYLGNICKTWTKDKVIETLKGYGIDQIEDILLPNDPKNEGGIKGFCFLEFASHSDAMSAFKRLRKPDAVFGCGISAKVSFAQTPLHPSEESLLQVRTVYLEGIPESWDEGKVIELCKKHGEIEKILLPKNISSSKRKDIGFVEFSSRDAALACVEGINNGQFGEGDVNVKANLAKPTYKGRLARQSARGGHKVTKDGEATKAVSQSKKKKKAKSKVAHAMEETQLKLKNSNGTKPPSSQVKSSTGRKGKMSQSYKGIKRGRQGTDAGTSEGTSDQPSKRRRNNQKPGNVRGRPSSFGNKRWSYSNQIMHAPSYAAPAANYTAHAYAGTSGSHYHRSDLQPHAGFLPAAQQVRNLYEHDPRRPGAYDSQLRGSSGYAGASLSHTTYPQYSSYPGYQAGYTYPNYGAPGYRGPH